MFKKSEYKEYNAACKSISKASHFESITFSIPFFNIFSYLLVYFLHFHCIHTMFGLCIGDKIWNKSFSTIYMYWCFVAQEFGFICETIQFEKQSQPSTYHFNMMRQSNSPIFIEVISSCIFFFRCHCKCVFVFHFVLLSFYFSL